MIRLSDTMVVHPYDYGWELHHTTKSLAKTGKNKGKEIERLKKWYFSSIEQCVFFAMSQGLKEEEIGSILELYETQHRMFAELEEQVKAFLD